MKRDDAKTRRRWVKRAFRWAFLLLLILFFSSLVQVAALRYIDPPFTAFMLADRLDTDLKFDLHLDFLPLKKISPNLARAVLAAEDQRFFEHDGIDWVEVKAALEDWREKGRRRGASTISMQLARNLFLWRGRNAPRKVLEIYYTFLLEAFLGKRRILELYLNVAEFGPGIYGAKAAARHFFQRSAERLTRDQSARLALMLPAPKIRNPNRLSRYLDRRRRVVLRQMRWIGLEGIE